MNSIFSHHVRTIVVSVTDGTLTLSLLHAGIRCRFRPGEDGKLHTALGVFSVACRLNVNEADKSFAANANGRRRARQWQSRTMRLGHRNTGTREATFQVEKGRRGKIEKARAAVCTENYVQWHSQFLAINDCGY